MEGIFQSQNNKKNEIPTFSTEAAILYAGTTGKPKGCILTNEYFHNFACCYLTRGGLLDLSPGNEIMYNPLPLHHANCLSISMPSLLIIGGCLIFPDRFHASTWWEDIFNYKVTSVHMQGIMPNILLKLPIKSIETQHNIKFGLCAGIEPNQHELFETRFGFPVVEFWAMTETGRLITDNFPSRRIGTRSFGKPTENSEAQIVDEKLTPLGPGQPGELMVRNSLLEPRKGFFAGYLNNRKATEEAWEKGWFKTGDTAFFDDDGYYYFMDRRKNIIRRAGENIAAAEVETCIINHPLVKQIAVIAVKDDIREEEVMACIQLKEGIIPSAETANQIFIFSEESLAYFKLPAWIRFFDSLPIGTSQKVQKK